MEAIASVLVTSETGITKLVIGEPGPITQFGLPSEPQITKVLMAETVSPGVGAGGAQAITGETPQGLINGVNTHYVTSQQFRNNSLALYANGLRMRAGVDFTVTGNDTFDMAEALQVGDSISVDYLIL
jgi:hypothetical protein